MAFLKQYAILFKKAKTDLKVSKNIYDDFNNGDEELDLEVVMFHLQQCAEKLLKVLLIYNNYHIAKTHDLNLLIKKILEKKITIISEVHELIPLTYFAVEGRYSIIHDEIDNVEKYFAILDKLVDFIKGVIVEE